jgi:hypothetical protein
MAKYVALAILAAALGACTTYDRSASAGATSPTHDVNVQMDRDNSIQKFATDYNLREGDRVRVQADGKVAPL